MTDNELSAKVAELRGDKIYAVYDCFDLLIYRCASRDEAIPKCENGCESVVRISDTKPYATDMNAAMELGIWSRL